MSIGRFEQKAVCKICYFTAEKENNTKPTNQKKPNQTRRGKPKKSKPTSQSPGSRRRIVAQMSCFLEIIGIKQELHGHNFRLSSF